MFSTPPPNPVYFAAPTQRQRVTAFLVSVP